MWKELILLYFTTFCTYTNGKQFEKSTPWWANSFIYQIYPRSFKDSDGDGIGDFKGIISKLEHIREVADAVWLSPFYTSPQRDFGYDISDYKNVNQEYGTLQDFHDFVSKAKSLGLKVILDYVPNHCSDEHEWFKKSIKRIKPYDEYFIWKNPKISSNGARSPPNNWLSAFGGSSWSWNEERQQYYYHKFAAAQPDLNYRNPLLQQEMKDILTFWMDRGADGFRVDAAATLFENVHFLDEPLSNASVPADDPDYLKHIYTSDLPETYDVVYSWRQLLNDYSTVHQESEKLLLMEAFSNLTSLMRYYDVDTDPMNLRMIHQLNNDSSAEDFRNMINTWMHNMPKDKSANWVVGNHDISRTASRFGHDNNRADQMSMLMAMLPGMMIVYNGDEIGMTDRYFTYEETVDPAGCNAGPERYQLKSRDPERTPYQWDDTVSAGFSTNLKTWLQVNKNYRILNLAKQKKEQTSHFKVFKALKSLKMTSVLNNGSLDVFTIEDKVLSIVRRLPKLEAVILLINFEDTDIKVDATTYFNDTQELMVYVGSVKSELKKGRVFSTSEILMPASASVILYSKLV